MLIKEQITRYSDFYFLKNIYGIIIIKFSESAGIA